MSYVRVYPVATPPAGDADVAFTWDAVATATSYTLEVGTATGQKDAYDHAEGNVLTKTLTLAAGTYYWRTKAYNGGSLVATTDEIEVTVI